MFSLGEQRPPEWEEPMEEERTNDVPAEDDVNKPSEQLKKLQDHISGLDGVDTGTKRSLSANLNNAITMAEKEDKEKSIDRLEKLIESIEKQLLPKERLSPEQAEYIIGELERIIELIDDSGVVIPPSDTPKMAEGTEMQVTADEFDQIAPSIYGSKIVWRDGRHVPFSDDHSYEIYSYDLVTGEESRVTKEDAFVLDYLSIYDDIIVWLDHRHYSIGSHFDDVYMLNLTTGQEQRITTSGFAWYPVIFGRWIAYKDGTYSGDTYVYAYNVDSGKTVNTTETAGINMFSVYDERLIWPCGDGFCLYDLSTSTKDVYANATPDRRLFANEPGYIILPEWGGHLAFYEDTVVWVDYRNSNWDIYMYNLSSLEETQLTSNGSSQILPEIYGNKVVWQDNRNGNWDIFMYDLTLKEEFQITEHSANQTQPAIYENKIVWQDDRNGNYDRDIYMFTLAEQGYSVNQEDVNKSVDDITQKASAESAISNKTTGANGNTTAGASISNSTSGVVKNKTAQPTEESTGNTSENTIGESTEKVDEDENASTIKDVENTAGEENANVTDESSPELLNGQVAENTSDEFEEESTWQVVENTTEEKSTEEVIETSTDESSEE
ncbi:cell surface protein [Methanolobus psychrophilus R15]|nr:cell surface protein [Methanolobus psychrophilus R15]